MNGTETSLPVYPTLAEAAKVWARIAALSFGGPAGQIAVMHRILVEEKRWLGDHRFLHALNFCMLLPGPEAQQLATYIGWLTADELGMAFGRENVIHAALGAGGLARRVVEEAQRLKGLRVGRADAEPGGRGRRERKT